MELTPSPATFRKLLGAARATDLTVGLVPTMGALHAGHISLIERARAECDAVAVTLFVNPLQFGPTEDFDAYPRQLASDAEKTAAAGADCLFAPSPAEMFPDGPAQTNVQVASLSEVLEGASRPTHFTGVCTIVTKLLALAGPCRAYFGEKDFQQLAIVRRLVADLSLDAEIVGCPIVREPDGLALSSRNARLTPDERSVAPVLYRALVAGAGVLAASSGLEQRASAGGTSGAAAPEGTAGPTAPEGTASPAAPALFIRAEEAMAAVLATEPLVTVDYAVVRDAATLREPGPATEGFRLLVAAKLGSVRLIDNLGAGCVSMFAPGDWGTPAGPVPQVS